MELIFEWRRRSIFGQNTIQKLWWQFVKGPTITVRWPNGWWDLDESKSIQAETADPNIAFRWQLEQYVGRQGWDWEWGIGDIAASNGRSTAGVDTLKITFRKKHAKWATYFAAKWA